ncbi:MAG: helix-turn-helix domain-containing protein [Alphaproteobacteria bacterium]|nr:helix-turn-helix domain-containing protein [Alphaproteobacteria bacterium]
MRQKLYHFTECGLDNVWLADGFTLHRTAYGRGVSFDDIEGVHRAIARHLVEVPGGLDGSQLRFLRKELDLSQAGLASLLGYDEQTVSRWERAVSTVPPAADRLLRALWREAQGEGLHLRNFIGSLAGRSGTARRRIVLQRAPRRKEGWQLAA